MINSNWHPISYTVSELSQLIVQFLTLCVFEPPFGVLGTTYDVPLALIGKRVVDFLIVLIELFSLGVIRLRRYTGKNRSKIGDFAPTGHFYPKFQLKGTSPANHSRRDS